MAEDEEDLSLLNAWDDDSDDEGNVAVSITRTAKRHHQSHFLGGVDDDDEARLAHLKELTAMIESVKQETRSREATLPVIHGPWKPQLATAPCRFHRWGMAEAQVFVREKFIPLVDDREKVWHVYKLEIVNTEEEVQAYFIGCTDYIQDELTRICMKMVTGQPLKRINDGERTPEYSRFTLLEQVGHAWYRKMDNLEFLRLTILKVESNLLNANRSTVSPLQIEVQAIEDHAAWITPLKVSHGYGGLNFWNPLTLTLQLKWGVSLCYLRTIFEDDDSRSRNWTIQQVFEKTLKPRAGNGVSYVEYLHRVNPNVVSERVDWFLSPSCHNCVWYKMICDGGITINSQIPKAIIRGDRFIYVDLFLRQ